MQAALDHIDWHAPQLATYWFKPDGVFRFVPGEFTELYVPHGSPDSRGQSREFTVVSTPAERLIGIMTSFPPGNQPRSTFKRALATLDPGDAVQLAETKGDFVAPRDSSIPLLFVAGGIGITPVISIVSHLKNSGVQRDVTVLHSAAKPETLVGKQLLTEYCSTYRPVLGTRGGHPGRITAHDILKHAKPETLVYISGSVTMVAALREQLLQNGVAAAQIVTDAFTGY